MLIWVPDERHHEPQPGFWLSCIITKPYEAAELGRNRPWSYRIRADKNGAWLGLAGSRL